MTRVDRENNSKTLCIYPSVHSFFVTVTFLLYKLFGKLLSDAEEQAPLRHIILYQAFKS
jgi:hypothetical protein